jgi:hypothetical protein
MTEHHHQVEPHILQREALPGDIANGGRVNGLIHVSMVCEWWSIIVSRQRSSPKVEYKINVTAGHLIATI